MNTKIGNFLSSIILLATLVSCTANEKRNPSEVGWSQKGIYYPSRNTSLAKLLDPYRSLGRLSSFDSKSEQYAMNIISWQMEHGGFGLHEGDFYERKWDGKSARSIWISEGTELGNFDDDATIAEMRYLAEVYRETNDIEKQIAIKHAVHKALTFIFNSQYETGGWPQVFPKRKKHIYSNYVTLNDHAMIRVMVLLADIEAGIPPFDSGLVAPDAKRKIPGALKKGVEYLLKAQIKNNGMLTIWGAQYDPSTYEPMSARKYEFASKASRESVGVLAFLMNWPYQTPKIEAAINGGVAWFKKNKIDNLAYKHGRMVPKPGAQLWYRYYELGHDAHFFGDRDGLKKYDLKDVSEERRRGYAWAGSFGYHLLKVLNRN